MSFIAAKKQTKFKTYLIKNNHGITNDIMYYDYYLPLFLKIMLMQIFIMCYI